MISDLVELVVLVFLVVLVVLVGWLHCWRFGVDGKKSLQKLVDRAAQQNINRFHQE
jgi:hypothetical protein